MKDNQRFTGHFGKEYDKFYEAVPWHDDFQSSHPKAFDKKAPLRLIEGGFGTGLSTEQILSGTNATILAIDSEPQMLKKASNYLGKDLSKRVTFVIGDLFAELKKLPKNSYDGFFSGYVIHNMPNTLRKKLFKEIARVLKPGAVYANADKIAFDNPKKQNEELAKQLVRLDIFINKHKDTDFYLGWVKHYLRDEEEDLIFREKEQVQLLKDNEFTNIKCTFREALECVYTARKK